MVKKQKKYKLYSQPKILKIKNIEKIWRILATNRINTDLFTNQKNLKLKIQENMEDFDHKQKKYRQIQKN